jgi:phosphoribosylaminoimidazole carboxylase
MEDQGIPVYPFCEVLSTDDCHTAGRKFGYPFILKNALLAYDGRGNVVVHSAEEVEECFQRLGGEALYAEKFVPFVKELAIMVVRGCVHAAGTGEGEDECGDGVMCFPVVETIQREGICDVVICPAQVPQSVAQGAEEVARRAVGCLRGRGVFGVELFMLSDGQILFNELAPRYATTHSWLLHITSHYALPYHTTLHHTMGHDASLL